MKYLKLRLCIIGIIFFSFIVYVLADNNTIRFKTDPPQRIDSPYRLFPTSNMWTHLLLDTRNGRIWQVQFSMKEKEYRFRVPINKKLLIEGTTMGVAGRFTLCPTDNMWTFLLLDQEDGRVWQCYFSMDKERFLLPILDGDFNPEAPLNNQ